MRPGLELGGFVMEMKLGAGGMGEVWLANQKAMDRKVALKILSPAITRDPSFSERFMREVKTSAKLSHPNIVTAHDAGRDKGISYLAVSFIEGVELGALLKMERRIPEEKALALARGVAEGLAYAWNRFKLIHRDIKPENIMIDSDGTPKLMDMGLSKSLAEEKSLTTTGSITGTPYYMSPEQAKGDRSIDFRSDIYSLGATLYHLATGEVPFNGDTAINIIAKHITDPAPCPMKANPQLSEACSNLIERMMAKNPKDRFATWEDVIAEIDRIPVRNGTASSLLSNRASIGLGALAIAMAIAIAFISCAKERMKSERKESPLALKLENGAEQNPKAATDQAHGSKARNAPESQETQSIFHGKLVSFDKESLEIELDYDFSDPRQLEDWAFGERGPGGSSLAAGQGQGSFGLARGKLFIAANQNAPAILNLKAQFEELQVVSRLSYEGAGFIQKALRPDPNQPPLALNFVVHGFGGEDGYAISQGRQATPQQTVRIGPSSSEPGGETTAELRCGNGKAFFKAGKREWPEIQWTTSNGTVFGIGARDSKVEYSSIHLKGRLDREWYEKRGLGKAPAPQQQPR